MSLEDDIYPFYEISINYLDEKTVKRSRSTQIAPNMRRTKDTYSSYVFLLIYIAFYVLECYNNSDVISFSRILASLGSTLGNQSIEIFFLARAQKPVYGKPV